MLTMRLGSGLAELRDGDRVVFEAPATTASADARPLLREAAVREAERRGRAVCVDYRDGSFAQIMLFNVDGSVRPATDADLAAAETADTTPVPSGFQPAAGESEAETLPTPAEIEPVAAAADPEPATAAGFIASVMRDDDVIADPRPSGPESPGPVVSQAAVGAPAKVASGASAFRSVSTGNIDRAPVSRSRFSAAAASWSGAQQGVAEVPGVPGGGPLVVLFANKAGGAGKTPTAIGVASAFGQRRGGDVALVDLNPAGNLADRLHLNPEATLTRLVRTLEARGGDVRPAELHDLMSWSAESRVWAVGAHESILDKSAPDGLAAAHISADQFRLLMEVLGQHFGMVCLDGGNNYREAAFLAACQVAHELVVPVAWDAKSIHGGLVVLKALEEAGVRPDLVERAIVVGSMGPWARVTAVKRDVRDGHNTYIDLGYKIMEVPADPHIHAARQMQWSALKPATQKAYAAIAEEISARQAVRR